MNAYMLSFSAVSLIFGSAASPTVVGQSIHKSQYSCPANTNLKHLSVLSHLINLEVNGTIEVSYQDEPKNHFPDAFYWTTYYTPEDEFGDREMSVRLQSFLPNPDVSTISTLAAAWGLGPGLSEVHDDTSVTGAHHFQHNETLDSWILKIPYEDLLSQEPSEVQKNKGLFVMGSMVASTESSLPFNVHTSEVTQAYNVKPSESLIGRVFHTPCFPARSVLVTDEDFIHTNDGFISSYYLDMEMIPPVEEGAAMTSVAMDDHHMFIAVGGSIYVASQLNKMSVFKRISLPEEDIIGVTSHSVCYRKLHPSPKSSLAYAWNPTSLVKIVVFGNSDALTAYIDIQAVLNMYPGSVLVEVAQAAEPNLIYLILKSHVWSIIECHIIESALEDCANILIPEQVSTALELNVEILNAALPSLLLWSNRMAVQIDGEENHHYTLSSPLQRVYLNPERMAWIMHSSDNTLQYGRVHHREMAGIKTPGIAADETFFLHFLSDFDVRYVRWQSKGIQAVEVYPLKKELNNAVLEEESLVPFSRFIGPFRAFNIIPLESLQDSFSVFACILWHRTPHRVPDALLATPYMAVPTFTMEFTTVYSRDSDFDFTVTENFHNLSLSLEVERSMITQRLTSHIVLHAMEFKLKMIADCKQSPEKCETGFAALEVRAHSGDESSASSLLQEHSQVFFINMTCPAGMNVRIGNIRNCTGYPDDCYIRIREDDFLDLRFHLYKYDEYISVITDDVLLTELNGRSGFVLHNINLMKKNYSRIVNYSDTAIPTDTDPHGHIQIHHQVCYQCSRFHEPESTSVLMLQTMGSACPCEVYSENENSWVGNISFKYADASTSGINTFNFSAKVLSRSLCNLNVDFTVELVAEPFLPFLMWEYIFIIVFIAATLVGLCFSYHNYVKHMKLNRYRRQSQ